MEKKYTAEAEAFLADWNEQLKDSIETFEQQLSNHDNETDLAAWGRGMDKFMLDNKELLENF